jgi:hypothetical protein
MHPCRLRLLAEYPLEQQTTLRLDLLEVKLLFETRVSLQVDRIEENCDAQVSTPIQP